jgi:hypothetical protein
MGTYRKRREWSRLVGQYRASGLSQREFAERRGLSAASLGRWSRRLLAEEANESEALTPAGLVEVVPKIDAMRPVEVSAETPLLRLRVGPAVCLELAECPSPQYVALVARAYEAVAPC